MKYDFITVLDRTGADSIAANIDPWGVSPAPAQRIPMWIADMSFPTAPPILEAMHKRLAFPNFGYFSMPDEYFDCILRWQETRNGLTGLKRADIGYENGVLGGVSSAVQALTVPGEAVLLHAPAYIGFTHVLDNLGRKAELSPLLRSRKEPALLISMAAGTSIFRIKELLSFSCPIIRIMPNTPAAVGEGMLLYSAGEGVSEQDLEEFRSLLSDAGRLLALPEEQLDAGSALSGCGPAFVCLFAEALADGGVLSGLKRQDALLLAAQTLLGTAKLLLVSGKHPGELKDQVCSPGGTTIEGVRQLEEAGFRGSVMNAVFASFEKNKRLG